MARNEVIKSGRFGGRGSELPLVIQSALKDKSDDWDWTILQHEDDQWIVVKIFDEGEEQERIAAVVKHTRKLWEERNPF